MEFTTFVRRPFEVEAVLITDENIAEIAEMIGALKTNDKDGSLYIALDRRLVPNMTRAYVGWWMTQLGDNYRCYSAKAFKEQFMPASEVGALAHISTLESVEDYEGEDATSAGGISVVDSAV